MYTAPTLQDTGFKVDDDNRIVIDKHPDEDLDYTLDFTRYFALEQDLPDTVAATALTTGVIVHDVSKSGSKMTAWVRGGVVNAIECVEYKIVTDSNPPRTIARNVYFNIIPRSAT